MKLRTSLSLKWDLWVVNYYYYYLLACRVEPGELSANQVVSLSRVVCPVRSRLQ